ncbi:MAG: DUF4384 domain-containing protein [Treponema sp.]|nr:DUF4384 domain-containing protein [Treponema sp.]
MRKFFLAALMTAFLGASLSAQQVLDDLIRASINNLASQQNRVLSVGIGSIPQAGTEVLSAFSHHLAGRIRSIAGNHNFLEVTALSRGISTVRPGAQQSRASITGNYTVLGDNVQVQLELIYENGTIASTDDFIVPIALLRQMGIELAPPNQQAVDRREQIIAEFDIPQAQDVAHVPTSQAFVINAWPSSESNTYVAGETLRFFVQSNRNCYFRLFYIDADNNMMILYPRNPNNPDNYLNANIRRQIPVTFVVQPPFGQETVIMEASSAQFDNLAQEIRTYLEPRPMTRQLTAAAFRGLGVAADGQSDSTSTRFNITTLPASPGGR